MTTKEIIKRIAKHVRVTDPNAEIILYGSCARGEETPDSDIDILILLDKVKISFDDHKRISHPLYEIEFDTGIIISPMLYAKEVWHTRHSITPFYKNVMKEGVRL